MADGVAADQRTTIGAVMVLVGLGFFIAIFVALFPVLTNPVGTYDRWFPADRTDPEQPITEQAAVVAAPVEPIRGPRAQFSWEAIGTASAGPTAVRIHVVSSSMAGDAPIVSTSWELGDGTTARGETVTHDYSALGAYTVVLRVTDANDEVDSIRGTVSVTGDVSGFGAANSVIADPLIDSPFDDLGNGLSDSLENAVGDVGEDINATIDTALGSIGSTVRGGVVVALFALASFAATVVAWRTARIGVMLLLADPDAGSRRRARRPSSGDEERPPRRLEAA